MPHISIVSPVYLAEDCVSELCRRLKLALKTITDDYEIILIEDRGPDNSWSVIQEEAKKDSRVVGVRLAKNFGQHRAITAGLDMAKGEWVFVMDCDLQDPPESIPFLYSKALEGYEIVIAQFEERSESKLRQKMSKIFWASLSWLAGIPFDNKIGNFRVMSRRAVENFRSYREQLRLLGGITSLMGFTTAVLPIKRKERYAGSSGYTFKKLLTIALDIILAYSDKPLKLSVIAGLLISIFAIIAGVTIFFLSMLGGVEAPGWASVMVSLYLIGGLIIANLGVIGFYIGKTFDEAKRRPLYVIENTTFDHDKGMIASKRKPLGQVIWITGLSGSGKSTLAKKVASLIRNSGEIVTVLDGDELRELFYAAETNQKNHNRDARITLAFQYAYLCRLLADQGLTVVIATISLFREVHAWNRNHLPNYFEVYLKVPIEELRRRDPKGIYKSFDTGDLANVAGLDLPIDEPEMPDWAVEFSQDEDADFLAKELLNRLNRKNLHEN